MIGIKYYAILEKECFNALLRAAGIEADIGMSTIAQDQIETEAQKRHLLLLEQNSQEMLTDDEREELRALRQRADLFTLQKAYAWALLRWRGYLC